MSLAIACSSGGYRVAFIQGVLNTLEKANIKADAYAGTSGSVIPAALAAMGQHEPHGLAYIQRLLESKSLGKGMSDVFLENIRFWERLICKQLWQPGTPRMVVPVSAVVTSKAAEQTQGETRISRRLGRSLLLASARHDRRWVNTHLKLELYDTQAINSRLRLTCDNFGAVAYASSRMLHAWDVPAWIDGRPCIDASYACSCPALELASMGYDEVIAISPERGPVYHDLYSTQAISPVWKSTPIHIIQPDVDLQDLSVYCTRAEAEGLLIAYHLGEAKGLQFLSEWKQGSNDTCFKPLMPVEGSI